MAEVESAKSSVKKYTGSYYMTFEIGYLNKKLYYQMFVQNNHI